MKKCLLIPVIKHIAGVQQGVRTMKERKFTKSTKLPGGAKRNPNSWRLPTSYSSLIDMPPINIMILQHFIKLLMISYKTLPDSPSNTISLTSEG